MESISRTDFSNYCFTHLIKHCDIAESVTQDKQLKPTATKQKRN